MKGEKADASFLPNKYVPRLKEESNKTAAWLGKIQSQIIF